MLLRNMKKSNFMYLTIFMLFFCARLYSPENELKNAEELFELGVAYHNGEGVPKDEKKAVELYRRAAAKGSSDALLNLSAMYYHGQGGLPKDEKKFLELLHQSANQGCPEAQFQLAQIFGFKFTEFGLSKDEKKAVELWKKAEAQGLAEAQFRLAGMYYLGIVGFPEDQAKAMELLKKAADQGLAEAKELQEKINKDRATTQETKASHKFRGIIAENEAFDRALDEMFPDDNKASDKKQGNQPSNKQAKKVMRETPELANALKAKISAMAMLQEADRLEKLG